MGFNLAFKGLILHILLNHIAAFVSNNFSLVFLQLLLGFAC